MKRILTLLALVALLVPLLAVQETVPVAAQQAPVSHSLDPVRETPFDVLEQARRAPDQYQVRIRQRVVVRISPAPTRARNEMLADLPRRPMRASFAEVEHDDCVAVSDIVGVQATADNRLLLFTSQRQVLAARLERSCVVDAFYSGFYVERNADGRLCADRDRLQSRAGASCEVAEFTRLVAVDE